MTRSLTMALVYLYNSPIENTFLLKATTLLITLAALSWALVNSQSVFSLVILAWSALASAFAPLLIVLSLGGKPGQKLSILAVITGLSVAMTWRYLSWHNAIYEGMAGIIAGLIIPGLPLCTSNKQQGALRQQV
jgi:sodium/proline symporter